MGSDLLNCLPDRTALKHASASRDKLGRTRRIATHLHPLCRAATACFFESGVTCRKCPPRAYPVRHLELSPSWCDVSSRKCGGMIAGGRSSQGSRAILGDSSAARGRPAPIPIAVDCMKASNGAGRKGVKVSLTAARFDGSRRPRKAPFRYVQISSPPSVPDRFRRGPAGVGIS
jgi:hypothetical protein